MGKGGANIELADGSYAQQVVLVNGGAAATSLAKAEDSAAASADAGIPAMAVQTASPADAASAGDYSMLQMKDGRLWVRDLGGLSASATFTPAAAEHVANDVHGGAQEFALAAPSGCNFLIRSVSMRIDGGTVETTVWKLHLFSVTPPSALTDDAAFALPSGDRASYLGYVSIPQIVDLGDTQWIDSNNIFKQVKLTGTSLFGYLTNDTTLTPAAVAHVVTINGGPV
jgi:hypothetical protein